MTEAKAWIADCFPDVEPEELTDLETVQGIQKYYGGGWEAFVKASG